MNLKNLDRLSSEIPVTNVNVTTLLNNILKSYTSLKRGKNALALMEDSEKRDAYLRVASSRQMLKNFLTELYWDVSPI